MTERRRAIRKVTCESFTLWSTQSGVTDTGVLVVAEMEKSGSAVPVQVDAFVHHSFYDVYSKNTQDKLKTSENINNISGQYAKLSTAQ